MDDDRFRVLLHVLKAMRDSESPKLESAIIRVIDTFRDALSNDQLTEAMAEFGQYERLRKERGRLGELLDEEKYRELVHRQPFKEETEMGD